MTLSLSKCVQNYFLQCKYEKNMSPKSIKACSIDLKQFADSISMRSSGVGGIDKTTLREYIRTISEGDKPGTIKSSSTALSRTAVFLPSPQWSCVFKTSSL